MLVQPGWRDFVLREKLGPGTSRPSRWARALLAMTLSGAAIKMYVQAESHEESLDNAAEASVSPIIGVHFPAHDKEESIRNVDVGGTFDAQAHVIRMQLS